MNLCTSVFGGSIVCRDAERSQGHCRTLYADMPLYSRRSNMFYYIAKRVPEVRTKAIKMFMLS